MTGKKLFASGKIRKYKVPKQDSFPLAARSCLHLQPLTPGTSFSIIHYADRAVQFYL